MNPVINHLPPEITDGELAAIAEASPTGWIVPPVYSSLRPEPARAWRSVHIRYLHRRGLIGAHFYRADGMPCVRLNDAAMAMRLPARIRALREAA